MGLAVGMRFSWRQGFAFNHRRDCSQRVLFAGDNDYDTSTPHASDKSLSTTAGYQVVHLEDWMVIPPELMHRHLLRQIEAGQFMGLACFRVLFIDQEASCLAGVLSDGAEVLTGDCNFHMTINILPVRSPWH